MVVGGVSAAIYGVEHTKANYAIPAESILIAGNNNLDVGDSISLVATSYGFTATEYTWTSGDASIATISGTDNTATVQGVSYGETYITASAQGANGVVISNQFTIDVQEFVIEIGYNSENIYNLPPNTNIFEDVGYWGQNGDLVFDVESSNTNVVTAEIDYDYCRAFFRVGNIEGISASVIITAKDNNGEPGYRTATVTVVFNVSGHYIAGDRVLTLPEFGQETLVLLANNDKTKFVYVDLDNPNKYLKVTTDIKRASLFAIDWNARFRYCFFEALNGNRVYVGTNGSYASLVEEPYSSQITSFPSYFNDKYNVDNWGDEPDPRFENYPGILATDRSDYLAFNNDANAHNNYLRVQIGGLSSLNNNASYADRLPPLFAYAAFESDPYITPEESSLTIYGDDRSNGTNLTVSKVTSFTYEIISGAQCIRSVSFSEVDDINRARVTVRAKDGAFGTAVIRVKSATDDSVYTDITVRVKTDPEQIIWTLFTQTQLSYRYTKEDGNYTYTDISIRFGGRIDKNTWNEINTDYHIDGFGVMITSFDPTQTYRDIEMDYLSAKTPDQEFDIDNDIVNYYKSIEDMIPAEDENDYYWNLFKTIDYADINKYYAATAYIKIGSDYFFMNQVGYSVCSLAGDYINSRGCNNETAGGSLQHLYELIA